MCAVDPFLVPEKVSGSHTNSASQIKNGNICVLFSIYSTILSLNLWQWRRLYKKKNSALKEMYTPNSQSIHIQYKTTNAPFKYSVYVGSIRIRAAYICEGIYVVRRMSLLTSYISRTAMNL